MLRKSVLVLLSIMLIFGTQVMAKDVNVTSGVNHRVDNSLVPEAPEPELDNVDEIIFFEDFESGMGDWTTVDLTDITTWHVDDFNAYGGAGLSWWAGDSTIGGYDDHWLQYLDSPTIDLSGTTNPVLTFDLFYAVEELSGGYPAPYDGWDGCNVWVSTDGGANWEVLTMTQPAYTCTSMYSFGQEWGMGPGIAGWGGFSGGISPGAWVDAEASLSGYTTSTVKIRFALCSDPVWSTGSQPELTGMFVDNIIVEEGAIRYLLNNAEGIAIPSDMDPEPGTPPTGNFWHLSEPGFPTPPSPTHVMEMSDGAGSYEPDIYNAVVSPVIDLTGYTPGQGNVFGDFYIRGSINVNDPDPFPDVDNWTVQVHPIGPGYGWYYYSNPWGSPSGTNYVMSDVPSTYSLWSEVNTQGVLDLNEYIGYEVQIRILFQSDPDQYFGEGLFVDDFWVEFSSSLNNDVGAEMLHVPMPTSAYFPSIHCSMELHNYGLQNQGSVPAFYRVNYGAGNPLIPWASINAGEMVLKEWDWTTPAPGSYFVDGYTALSGDENMDNDSSKAGLVEITAEDVLEFGYDNREYSYSGGTFYYFFFGPGQGPYVKFTPEDDGIDFNMDGQYLKGLFREPGTLQVHIYEPGTATDPGPEVTSFPATVTQTYPAWQQIDISGVDYLQNTRTDFWVWFETTAADSTPHITGWNEIIHGEGHFFTNFNFNYGPSQYDFYIRAVFSPSLGVEDPGATAQPNVFALHQNTPNPFNPSTTIEFSLDHAAAARLAVFDLMGRTVAVLADGNFSAGSHSVTFNASDLSSGVYVYRLESEGRSLENKMVFLK
jgi:hypothetical protein